MSLLLSDCEQVLIGGQWTQASSSARLSVSNPATAETLGTVPDCGEQEVANAVEAASRAFENWARTPPVERETLLLQVCDLIRDHSEDLAKIITLEEGKPLAESRAEVSSGAAFVRWYAAEGRRLYGDIVPAADPTKRSLVFVDPIGPVLVVTPWNDPFGLVMRKVAPAIAAGCSVIIKPAEQTPFSAIASARLFAEAGLPAGVVNVVTTSHPAEIVNAILSHNAIRHLTFTGSTEVGKIVGSRAGALVKRITSELGGHAPFIVFDDADIDQAVEGLLARKFRNAGQTCSCPSRVFLQNGIASRFLEAFVGGVGKIVVGNGLDPGVTMGPLIDAAAVKKVRAHVSDAVSKGARICFSGRPTDGLCGTFFPPTVIADVLPEMLVAREETFGPVAAFLRFADDRRLCEIANHPAYGLAGYCYTRDLSRAFRVAQFLRCGFIGINDSSPQSVEVPMGGIGESGIGREGGRWGIEEFVTTKYVSFRV